MTKDICAANGTASDSPIPPKISPFATSKKKLDSPLACSVLSVTLTNLIV